MTDYNSKCIVHRKDDYVNIPADRLTEAEGMVYVWHGESLVGIFDLGTIDEIYISQCVR